MTSANGNRDRDTAAAERAIGADGGPAPLAPPSPTGVRIAGDDYQWLHAWRACLYVLRDHSPQTRTTNPAVAVGVEVDHARNVDDVVLFRRHPPHAYSQVKYAVDASTPLNTAYLTTADSGMNMLSKFAAAHTNLTAGGEPVDMSLVTNRTIDPTDLLLAGRDARSGLLMPKGALQTVRSARGIQRKAWADAAAITEAKLVELLNVLKFETGHDVRLLTDNIANLMVALGLKSDSNAQALAAHWVQQQVINGIKTLNLDAIRGAVKVLELDAGRPWHTISVATLKVDALADQALYAIDWVDRFDGDDPYTRRRPKAPATWSQLDGDIKSLPERLSGVDAALITGSMRLSTGFATGAALRGVAGFDVAVRQGQQLWRSDEHYDEPLIPHEAVTQIGHGDDLAVVIDIAASATDEVIGWIRDTGLPVARVLTLAPPDSPPKDNSIPDASTAVALTMGIRNAVRRHSRDVSRIHLFQAGPLGLAVLLGHRWNRVKPTVVYEDIPSEGKYEPAFEVQA